MTQLKNVFFKPWVGKDYENGIYEGKKLLILGESHYCGGCDKCGIKYNPSCDDFNTNKIVEGYLKYNAGERKAASFMKNYTKFVNVIFNRKINSEEMKNFWDSIIFYNYVQVAIEETRKTPTEEEFKLSEDGFFEVLNEYQPDLVIIWGERLFNNMPSKDGGWMSKKVCDVASENVYSYNIDGKNIPCYCVYHPSSSKYNYSYHKYIDTFLKEY